MLPYRKREEEIREKNPTPKAIRDRQYLSYLNWRDRHPPLADIMMKHSANEVHDWRRSVSGDRPDLFEGLPVMGAA